MKVTRFVLCFTHSAYKYATSVFNVRLVSYFFFFFQAEDGIRDLTVTGVQTCALPISGGVHAQLQHIDLADVDTAILRLAGLAHGLRAPQQLAVAPHFEHGGVKGWRSEERRVGKECRSRWAPYH